MQRPPVLHRQGLHVLVLGLVVGLREHGNAVVRRCQRAERLDPDTRSTAAALAEREALGDPLADAAWLVALFGVAAVVVASGLPVFAGPLAGVAVAVVAAVVLGAVVATGLGARRAAGPARAWAAGLEVEEQG